ncbi:phospholipid-transporting ATPase VD-like [Haliotis cracherodii]|uniref:phospholipid-transporting ATPase VD-like n=1 Tax=Haliotis cracherodii TaxID=6455 RepID=UPI0039EC9502
MGNIFKRSNQQGPKFRTVVPNQTVEEEIKLKTHPNYGYRSNRIKTTKYSILTFFPKNIFEQFHRFANLYFIFVVGLNWVPEIQAFGKEIAMIPVIFVLAVTAIKDGFEDFRRYRSDKKINSQNCRVYSRECQRYVKQHWSDIHPGDFIHLSCNEIIPADILLLKSSDPMGLCHLETSNLDGENNLKQRHTVSGFEFSNDFEISRFKYKLEVELPNSEIYKFRGYVEKQSKEKIPLSNENLLLRGCILKNTDFIEGIVVYAGHETKAMLNNRGPRYKRSMLERKINRDVIWCVILLLFLCFFCAIGSGIWLSNFNGLTDNTNYVPFIPFGDLDKFSPVYQGFIVFWTYIIIFQTVIPLPMYVSLELVKIAQVYFINNDKDVYHELSNKRLECRALNITEDLGQIEYIFSDKTGTLTENLMEFKTCTIGGVDYPHMPGDEESDFGSRMSIASMSRSSSIYENLPLEPALQRELSNMCLRSLDSVQLTIPEHVKRVQEFFLLMAVCNTVVVSHHPHEDMMDESGLLSQPEFLKQASHSREEGLDRYNPLPEVATPPRYNKARGASLASLNSESDYQFTSSDGSIAGSSSQMSDSSLRTRYEAESPDELALVKAASTYGCRLIRRSPEKVTVWLPGDGEVEFEVLNILQFDSVRKRMSVIIKHPQTEEITLYVKGADSSVLSVLDKRFKTSDGEEKAVRMKTEEHITEYAMKGLRTLCMAKRTLSPEVYKEWQKMHQEAEAALENRETQIRDSACRIEEELDLLGATGIEDRLQDGVPETIAKLRQAGINIWVLTGDKQETAIEIAYASKLFHKEQELVTLNSNTKEEAKDLIVHHIEQINLNRPSPTRDGEAPKEKEYALIIDGKTLAFALNDSASKKGFLNLTKKCNSVVCCRATPIQKGHVVKLVKEDLKKLTLAIGDGANDVSMIQTADIGIGISGQEGMQAVMSSDFAIARFKYLERLLLVHGHWCYDRLSKFGAFMFYKSLMSVMLLFWYQFFSGFSGSLMLDSIYMMLLHLIFTSLPPIVNGIFDKDVSAEVLLERPELYSVGQKGEMYTHWTFLMVLLDAIYQSAVLYFIAHLAYSEQNVGMWEYGTTIMTALILIILLHLGIETNSWTWIQWLVLIMSFLFFWMFAVISNAIFFTWDHPSNPYWVMENTISTPIHSCVVIISCVVALLPRLCIRAIQATVYPSVIMKVKQLEKELIDCDQLTTITTISEVGDSKPPDSARNGGNPQLNNLSADYRESVRQRHRLPSDHRVEGMSPVRA